MSERADAHAHLFSPGFVAQWPESCRRVLPDEVTLYEALARQHAVKYLLAVGCEVKEVYRGNNTYLAELAAERPWIRPVAFVHEPDALNVPLLEALLPQRFVGISLYIFSEPHAASLAGVADEVWDWLSQRRWLLSVNSRGEFWSGWTPVLEKFPRLRLLLSHLGLPPAMQTPPTAAIARSQLSHVLELAKHPGTNVKLSGFYALTKPGHDYPHRAAWPYVEALIEAFGPGRLLWGSDFSPSLEFLSFPQTYDLFSQMPFLSHQDRQLIQGRNLIELLDDASSPSRNNR